MPAVAVRGGGGVNGRRGVCNAVFSACCGKFVYRDAGKMPALRGVPPAVDADKMSALRVVPTSVDAGRMPALRLLLIFSLRQIEQGCTVIRGLFAPLGLGPGSRWMQAGCLRYGSVPQASRLLLVQTRCLRYGASRLLLMQAGCVRYGVVPACGRTEWFHGLPLPARCVRRSGDYEMNRG